MVKVVDLFSGAGGLTFGFKKKINRNRFVNDDRFSIVFANELDPYAAQAFRINFPDITMLEEDISKVDLDLLNKNRLDIEDIDVVIGGPPCQSFSTVGKRQFDNRAKMYKEYQRLLSLLQPKMFIFENVLGILSMKNDNGEPVINDIKESFSEFYGFDNVFGYNIHMQRLNAEDFGVPQNRERVFLVGIRKDLNINIPWHFPEPLNSRDNSVTVRDAIGDLPMLQQNETIEHYQSKPSSRYQHLMRGKQKKLNNHLCGEYGERMTEILEAVGEGEGKANINELVKEGKLPENLFLTSGYKNTYARLWWDKPSTTITNNLSTPSSLRCIHPRDNRALTSREGARLQSFPDDFCFFGPKAKINSQIGNAVPPLLALSLADSVYEFFMGNFGG